MLLTKNESENARIVIESSTNIRYLIYIHKTNWRKMITAKETGNEELLSQLIGENIDPKRIREMSKEPVSREIHAIKINKEVEEEIEGEDLEPQEAVQHTLNAESANYYMDMSGIKKI